VIRQQRGTKRNQVGADRPSHWADGVPQVPVGVPPYRPAVQLPGSRADPALSTTSELAGSPSARLLAARIRSVLTLPPAHGTGQYVDDPAHLPAFSSAKATADLRLERWQQPGWATAVASR
jgi:hypothetical protein